MSRAQYDEYSANIRSTRGSRRDGSAEGLRVTLVAIDESRSERAYIVITRGDIRDMPLEPHIALRQKRKQP